MRAHEVPPDSFMQFFALRSTIVENRGGLVRVFQAPWHPQEALLYASTQLDEETVLATHRWRPDLQVIYCIYNLQVTGSLHVPQQLARRYLHPSYRHILLAVRANRWKITSLVVCLLFITLNRRAIHPLLFTQLPYALCLRDLGGRELSRVYTFIWQLFSWESDFLW